MQTGRYVRLGLREYTWLLRMDGQVDRKNIPEQLGIDSPSAEELLKRLEAAKLICFSETPVRLTRLEERKLPATAHVPTIEWMQFGQLRIRIKHSDLLLANVAKLKVLKNKLFLAITLCIAVMGLIAGIRLLQLANIAVFMQNFSPRPSQLVILLTLIFLTTAFHEFGHAVACAAFGAPVRSMGIMIYYLQPAAYADITDSWRLKNKWHRVAISSAGIYVQAVINVVAVIALMIFRASGHKGDVLLLFIAINLSTIIFNLMPFVKLDGYWILSTILSLPNLRDRAREWLQAYLLAKVRRRPIDKRSLRYNAVLLMSPMGQVLLGCFGVSSNVFGVAMWAAGLSFMFRISLWLGLRGSWGYLFVAGLLILGIVGFIVRSVLARRRTAATTPAPSPVKTTSVLVTHEIDYSRPVRLNPCASVLDDRRGTLVFAWTSADSLSVAASERMRSLLASLRRGISLNDLKEAGSLDGQAEQVLQRLWSSKHLRYSSEWELHDEEQRYSRQLGWLSFNEATKGLERATLSRLKAKSVAILGVGGVGSNVALNLAACGVGELHLVDGDKVELTNLNRQLLYTPSDVGRLKTEVAKEKLEQFNPALNVRTTSIFLNSVEDIMMVIEGADFVVRSLDTPVEAQSWVNQACVQKGIPSTGAGFTAQSAVIGPTVVPGTTACLACKQIQMPLIDRGVGATLAPIVTITAGIVAHEVIAYLGGLGGMRTTTGMVVIESPNFAARHIEAARDENCAVCGVRSGVPA